MLSVRRIAKVIASGDSEVFMPECGIGVEQHELRSAVLWQSLVWENVQPIPRCIGTTVSMMQFAGADCSSA